MRWRHQLGWDGLATVQEKEIPVSRWGGARAARRGAADGHPRRDDSPRRTRQPVPRAPEPPKPRSTTMNNSAPLPGSVSSHSDRNQGLPQPKEKTRPSGLELVSEVSGLTAGLGLLIFTLTPLALPALALTPPRTTRASKRSFVSSPLPPLPAPAMSPARSSSPTADAPRPDRTRQSGVAGDGRHLRAHATR